MKPTTQIYMGANHVGEKEPYQIWRGTFVECIMDVSRWLAQKSVLKRVDIVIARSEEECRGALKMREERKESNLGTNAETIDELTQMMNQLVDHNAEKYADEESAE